MSISSSTGTTNQREIWLVPFLGQGHLVPSVELCKHLASPGFKVTLIISSPTSASIPSSLRQNPLVQITKIPSSFSSSPPPPRRFHRLPPPQNAYGSDSDPDPLHFHRDQYMQFTQGLYILSTRMSRPVVAVIDVTMAWSAEIFKMLGVPVVGFFTSGAASAAMEYALSKAEVKDIGPGEKLWLPGLPEEMALTELDLKRGSPPGPPGGLGPGPGFSLHPGTTGPNMMGPPQPGQQPRWLEELKGSIALMINTCDDLEMPFINYLADQIGKPIWGVGPLLPEQLYKSSESLIHDREIRSNRQATDTEEQMLEWLDSKPRGSVLYVSFGVCPTLEEHSILAGALKATNHQFIWFVPGAGRPCPPGPPRQLNGSNGPETEAEEGYFPRGLASRVGERGLIIRGWEPQPWILSHPSTGGYLSHCGWNSTVEALGRGVPILAWPIGGDQHYNAKLVIDYLKVGYMVSDDPSGIINVDDVIKGVERLMGDKEMKKRAEMLRRKFDHGFPKSSEASLDAFRDLIVNHKVVC